MTIGGDTFINNMLTYCGFLNLYADLKRYPVVEINDLIEKDCKLLLLSTEPYPFQQKHIMELQMQMPETTILLADGEMFSWYGSRLLTAPAYFSKLIALAEN
jgi:ABC-type Fe3+-hydroxamate transport system substrate-binding protein